MPCTVLDPKGLAFCTSVSCSVSVLMSASLRTHFFGILSLTRYVKLGRIFFYSILRWYWIYAFIVHYISVVSILYIVRVLN